ncbi:GAF and ANTAR domain-containing protein [Nocardioides hwasunensis]|uniref:GAF and ANTAR domain-containing protein n=1 Tax=Nocardioides hwasunensis TaxID=397258 RepID=A0ABR8MFY3_9ACTN|nr:GAF and ANTAR domain-containing protein [Nocardioides hwasunensis]MBD3914793.1 GAF and ANTAR domain-containing protein [Nocardioides hwasunensis]
MTEDREPQIIRAFVELSQELIEDYDVIDMLAQLTASCASLLDISSAGLLLGDSRGQLHLAAASSERTHHLELFQLQRDEGPCLDSFHDGEPVSAPDLDAAAHRWPQFQRAALDVGIRSVHALPMRLKDNVLGAVGLFGDETGDLHEDDLALAQALVHVASVAIVHERAATDRASISALLDYALTSRIVVEQAKGALAYAGDLDMDDAFAVLRLYARDHRRKLSEVANEIVNRLLPYDDVLQHARSSASST